MDRTQNQDVNCFSAADVLLPSKADLQRWAVIACDQFTSQPEYWHIVEEKTAGIPSSYHLILPEAELKYDCSERIEKIHNTMLKYLEEKIFQVYSDCFIFTERELSNGSVRRGLIGKVDLEQYDYSEGAALKVRATERTVAERIPPRMKIRKEAALELPHILLLCNDERHQLIEPFSHMKTQMPKLYDFELMMSGGHVSGWLISGELKDSLEKRLAEYEHYESERYTDNQLVYAVGDGNHSLATAKACYEELKRNDPETDFSGHPARYVLCELNNIRDENLVLEPIHRIVKNCDTKALINDLMSGLNAPNGVKIPWVSAGRKGAVTVSRHSGSIPLAALQMFLDDWLQSHDGELDYIHGTNALRELEKTPNCIGFRLPPIDKEKVFEEISANGVLPRKSFSLGEAEDKRYYLEARKIL